MGRLFPLLCCLLMAGVLRPSPALADGDAIYVALLVGSNQYQGDEGLSELEYADDDVLRFAQTIRPLVGSDNLTVLLEPDAEVAQGLDQLGVADWQSPAVDQLWQSLQRIEGRIRDLKRHYGEETDIRLLFFISAHGDAFGVHLADGVMGGPQLQSALSALSADSVLLIADACFSSNWLVLKGGETHHPAPDFPLDAVADAVRDLERVGMVAAQSGTREERGLVRGGLLTHMVSSALIGAADLDQDGRVLYPELEAYLGHYAENSELLRRIQVQAPRKSVEKPAVLVDLSQLGNSGLLFPQGESDGPERFWVRDEEGRLVAELAKSGAESRRIYLPPGRYLIQHFGPPNAWYGREGRVDITSGFIKIGPTVLNEWWIWNGGKGRAPTHHPIPEGARALNLSEASYRVMSPVKSGVSWRALPGRNQGGISLMGAGWAMQVSGEKDPVNSLSLERPFYGVGLHWDHRWIALGQGRYLSLGLEGGLGRSTHNQVGDGGDVEVWRSHYRPRFSLEIERANYAIRAVFALGASSAFAENAVLPLLPSVQFSGVLAWQPARINTHVFIGFGPAWDAEPHQMGPDIEFSLGRSFTGFFGLLF